jgi:hypothetical protein
MPNWKKVVVSGSDASLNSLYSSGPITGSDLQITGWDSVSASLATLSVPKDNYVEWYLSGDADSADITSQKWVKFTGGQTITGTGTEVDPYIMTIQPTTLGTHATGSNLLVSNALTTVSASLDHITISDEYIVSGIKYRVYENTNVNTGETVVAAFPTTTGYAAHFDYLVRNNSDLRAGKVVIIQDGSSINITDTSTTDIGFTGGLVFDARIVSGQVELVLYSDADGWIFKSDCKII